MKRTKRFPAILLCFLFCVMVIPCTVFARGLLDTTKRGSLTVQYACADIPFSLYRVADISEYSEFTGHGPFSAYPLDYTSGDWATLATTLASYIDRDSINPYDTKRTNKDGQVTFSTLKPGLYYVSWPSHYDALGYYTSAPFVICVPSLDAKDAWVYDVTATAKYTLNAIPGPTPTYTELRVHKSWADDNDAAGKRPDSITVQLLKDGAVEETVTLSAANGWSHGWSNLSSAHIWRVAESGVPAGYTVRISQAGITYLITNTYTPETTTTTEETTTVPDDTTTVPGETTTVPKDTTSDTTAPDTTTETTTPVITTTEVEPELPKTGVLWWPVPLLASCGLILFCGGWALGRKPENHV